MTRSNDRPDPDERLRTIVQAHVGRVVSASGSKVEAARRLGISRSSLYRHLFELYGPTLAPVPDVPAGPSEPFPDDEDC
jgi:DNA-binding phage protein